MTAFAPLALAALALVLALLLALVWGELRRARRQSPDDAGLAILQQQLDALRDQVRASLEGGQRALDRRLEETQRAVGDVRRGLGAVDRQVRSVQEVARDLRGLQELLRSPQARGGLGEQLLGELLSQVLPRACFELQYAFPTGERVDAVLRVGDRLVPVDAKFPLDNFRRLREAARDDDDPARRDARRAFRTDVRRHVEAIATRYIRPGEGTYEFALMYVPSEAVYQELLAQEGDDGLDLLHLALARRVVPVSPQSFWAYLQVILLGLRGLDVETRAREILERLGSLRTRLDRFGESFDTAMRHLGHAGRQFDESGRRLARLEAALDELSDGPLAAPGSGGAAAAAAAGGDAGDAGATDQKRNDRPPWIDAPPSSSSSSSPGK